MSAVTDWPAYWRKRFSDDEAKTPPFPHPNPRLFGDQDTRNRYQRLLDEGLPPYDQPPTDDPAQTTSILWIQERPAEGELLQRPTEVLRRGARPPKPPPIEVIPIDQTRPVVPDPRLVVEEKGLDVGLVALVIGCGAFVLALLAGLHR